MLPALLVSQACGQNLSVTIFGSKQNTMSIAIITGSAGLIGPEAALCVAALGLRVVGIDNDMRPYFFGEDASTARNTKRVESRPGRIYTHAPIDIRDRDSVCRLSKRYASGSAVVIHTDCNRDLSVAEVAA